MSAPTSAVLNLHSKFERGLIYVKEVKKFLEFDKQFNMGHGTRMRATQLTPAEAALASKDISTAPVDDGNGSSDESVDGSTPAANPTGHSNDHEEAGLLDHSKQGE